MSTGVKELNHFKVINLMLATILQKMDDAAKQQSKL